MPEQTDIQITQILNDLTDTDDATAIARLLPEVYKELRALSESYLAGERPNHTLQATALVHEAYVRLAGGDRQWKDRVHFFRAAAKTMRHILLKHAEKHNALKRGGGCRGRPLSETQVACEDLGVEVLALDEAMQRLAQLDAEKAKVVELRFYAGCTIDETAETLGISTATVERHWRFARAWLRGELAPDG
ncbi:MAG: sigma-70 family RNA polymerase sigma factor [Planctomycetota bacterium]